MGSLDRAAELHSIFAKIEGHAMAVAIKNNPETDGPKLLDKLAVESWLGAFYVLGSIAIVFFGIPVAWDSIIGSGSAVRVALMMLLVAVAAVALSAIGVRLLGSHQRHGLKAGIFFGVVGLIAATAIMSAFGKALEKSVDNASVGLGIVLALEIVLLIGLGWLFSLPNAEKFFITVEDQGWFSTASYKRAQGMRVRRGTMLGILVLAGCGVYTLLAHKTLDSGPRDWRLPIPFTDGRGITLLPDVRFTVPILLIAGSLWLAYRVVSFPTFADFLIATEAEMNKVSWTTRKRLIQDTIVVLVTVALMTTMLFVFDQSWAWALTKLRILQVPESTSSQADSKGLDW